MLNDLRIVARVHREDPKLAKQLQGFGISTRIVNGETVAILREKGGQNGSTRWRLPNQFSTEDLWIAAAEILTRYGYSVIVCDAEEGNPLPIWTKPDLRPLRPEEHALFLGQRIVTVTGMRGSGLVIIKENRPIVRDQTVVIETREAIRARPEHLGCTPFARFVPAAREAVRKANCAGCTTVHYGMKDGVVVSHVSS